jgi:hypothetical protein
MTFQLDDIINGITDYLTDNKYVKSPIWVAIIIVVILILTIWFVVKSEIDTIYEDTSMLHLYVKIGIWSVLSSIVVIFLHNKSIHRFYEEKYKNIGQEQAVEAVVGKMESSDTEDQNNVNQETVAKSLEPKLKK